MMCRALQRRLVRVGLATVAAVLVAASVVWLGPAGAPRALAPALALAVVAGVLAVSWWRAQRELERLSRTLRSAIGAQHEQGAQPMLDTLIETQRRQQARASETAAQLLRAEERLRESEERYALAVRGANDGMWEWDIAKSVCHYSPRWKNMLGYAEHEVGEGVEEWLDRVHPEDRPLLRSQMDAHLLARSAHLSLEHRIRHRDGDWRWVSCRATAVRNAEGRPHRLIGLLSDISARKRVQEALIEIADCISAVQGEACFRALARSFAKVLHAREAFLCECMDAPAPRVRMLAYWRGTDFAPCVEFDLAGTACEEVVQEGRMVYFPSGVSERWPLERQYQRDGYLGIPCVDSRGEVIGHLAVADPDRFPAELPHAAILRLFAVRAGIELERRRMLVERARFVQGPDEPRQTLH